MKRLIAALAALAFGFACLPALAQGKMEEKKESLGQKAREAKGKVKDELTESRAEKKAESADKKAKKRVRRARGNAVKK
jgi:beta-lactam-binding protein with PASTA domain